MARYSSAFIDDIYQRRSHKSKLRSNEKAVHVYDKSSRCKLVQMKIVLATIISGSLLTLFYSPDVEYLSNSGFRWIWDAPDFRYVSKEDMNLEDIKKTIEKVGTESRHQGIGLLNFNRSEIKRWEQITPEAKHLDLRLEYLDWKVTWETLYPEWIDEEHENEVPVCPSIPTIEVPRTRIDLIAVKLPCRDEGNWSKDVGRLHLQLAAASFVVSSKGYYPLYVLFLTKCFPIPNLFTCEELVLREGNVWLYKPNIKRLREKLQLPVGSCEVALPLTNQIYSGNPKREAYVTILHSANVYVCGAIVAAQSIRMSGSMRDLVILVDETISDYHRTGLEAAGWKIRVIRRIRNPRAEKDAYNEWNYSKFRLWQLTDYDKIVFIDADVLILRNIDFLFGMPEITATGNNGTLFNSGVMVIEPSNCTFQLLMDHINEIESYNGGDQGYLNEIFTWWHRIPKHINFLKHFWIGDEDDVKAKKTRLFGAEPPVLYVIHYLGVKPWLCLRDYDCNWNVDILQEFASDVAHKRWWMIHDAMPERLHQFCLLRSKQKAQLEVDRRQAEKANYTDGHWRINGSDSRLNKCIDNSCFWESMLLHWGETNSTK